MSLDNIELSLFVSRMEAVCDEMGGVLKRTAFSPNIKDRLDFSCALFDADGQLCAQAAHIPVHLGSMAFAMQGIVNEREWVKGDVLILNDPFRGGTHLPDVTVIAPVFAGAQLACFVANRAHHASIGSDTPGSMPNSSSLQEEGLVIEPRLLFRQGKLDKALWQRLYPFHTEGRQNDRPGGDIAAQISALNKGVERCHELLDSMGLDAFTLSLEQLNDYGERVALSGLGKIPDGEYSASDLMDSDGQGNIDVLISIRLIVKQGRIIADFTGTADQVRGNINCPLSVTAAGVYYVFRCLLPDYAPACAGLFRPVTLLAPEGSLVNARFPAAVVAGNVETSSRIVDVVMKALSEALPDKIPAASQGTMNNVAMGASGHWDYYETIAGGIGAGPNHPGLHAVHSHMTNTLNTPVESLESHYPLRIRQYCIRRGSGGDGLNPGGDGLCREYEFLGPTRISLLSERRAHPPFGLQGGQHGSCGVNLFNSKALPSKVMLQADKGDWLSICTPGGGGWGNSPRKPAH